MLEITDWTAPLNALFDAVVLLAIIVGVWACNMIRRL